ncbi:MAG: hypothetical protein ACLFVU_07420, partial [Phycisphaerae bacterium]
MPRFSLTLLANILIALATTAVSADTQQSLAKRHRHAQVLAAEYLWAQQQKNGRWDTGDEDITALVLACDTMCTSQTRLGKSASYLKDASPETQADRARLVLALNRMKLYGGRQGKYSKCMQAMGKQMLAAASRRPAATSAAFWEVLGFEGLAEARIEIPKDYWLSRLKIIGEQNEDGGWGQRQSQLVPTIIGTYLTAAGQCHVFSRKPSPDVNKAIAAGLGWIEKNLQPSKLTPEQMLMVSEMVRVTGKGDITASRWIETAIAQLAASQKRDGSWGGPRATALALLTLDRLRPPMFMQLQYKQDDSPRRHAIALLNSAVTPLFCMPPDYRVALADMDQPVDRWPDAPVAILTGSGPVKLSAQQRSRLKTFILRGGCVLASPTGSPEKFVDSVKALWMRILPQWAMTKVPAKHAAYGFALDVRPLQHAWIGTNGTRPMMFLTPTDLVTPLREGKIVTSRRSWRLPANLMLLTDYRFLHRLRLGRWPAEPKLSDKKPITIARIRFKGNWNPEPLATQALARRFEAETGRKLKIETVEIDKIAKTNASFAWIVLPKDTKLRGKQWRSLALWVAKGNTLLGENNGWVDMKGREVLDQVSRQLPKNTTQTALKLNGLPLQHPDYPLKAPRLTRMARQTHPRLPENFTPLQALNIKDRAAVIHSDLDLSRALLGCFGCQQNGYLPESAYPILRNLILNHDRGSDS